MVTSALAEDLRGLEPGQSASTEPLDPTDSHVALARHLAAEVQRVLGSVRGEDKPDAQVECKAAATGVKWSRANSN